MSEKLSILYVDDEESNLNVFRNTFRREYNVFTATSGVEGLTILQNEQIDLILTDQRMPDMNGVEFLKETLSRYPDLNRILVTGYTDFGALTDAVNDAKIFQFIQKPWDDNQLREIIEKSLLSYRLKKENNELKISLQNKNKELETVNKELLEYDKLKSDFLALISHEIRTPLNGLKGPFQLLKDELGDNGFSSVESLLNILEVSVKRLEQFALSALHITSFKAQQYELVLEVFNVTEQFENVFSHYTQAIEDKELTVKKDFDKNLMLKADKDLFFICIKEVLDNAIKYSEKKGKIHIEIIDTPDTIEFVVRDEGDGFIPSVLKHLFAPFVTEDRLPGSNVGLDLTLVKLIMDAHKGEIQICNHDVKGAIVKMLFQKNMEIFKDKM